MNTTPLPHKQSFMPVQYTFSQRERDQFYSAVSRVTISPYADIVGFIRTIDNISLELKNIVNSIRSTYYGIDFTKNPAFYLKECPIDRELPILDHEDPVASKHQLKKTFFTEAFILFFANCTGSSPVGYRTINSGDLFHDGYLKNALCDTQSQKSMVSLGFHNDLPNNQVRPTWVNIVCLRNALVNRVATSFVRNIDILDMLSTDTKAVLSKPIFHTPPEVIAVHGGKSLDDIDIKPIFYPQNIVQFVYFENRTTTDSQEGRDAIAELDRVLHREKEAVFLESGDLISINNNTSIHCREVIDINDIEAHKKRWLMKTWNVGKLSEAKPYLIPGRCRVVDE